MPNETSERIVKIRIGLPLQNCKIIQTDGAVGSRVTISKIKIEVQRTVFKTIWRMGSTLPRTVYGIPTETIDKWIRGKALRYNLTFSSRIQFPAEYNRLAFHYQGDPPFSSNSETRSSSSICSVTSNKRFCSHSPQTNPTYSMVAPSAPAATPSSVQIG